MIWAWGSREILCESRKPPKIARSGKVDARWERARKGRRPGEPASGGHAPGGYDPEPRHAKHRAAPNQAFLWAAPHRALLGTGRYLVPGAWGLVDQTVGPYVVASWAELGDLLSYSDLLSYNRSRAKRGRYSWVKGELVSSSSKVYRSRNPPKIARSGKADARWERAWKGRRPGEPAPAGHALGGYDPKPRHAKHWAAPHRALHRATPHRALHREAPHRVLLDTGRYLAPGAWGSVDQNVGPYVVASWAEHGVNQCRDPLLLEIVWLIILIT
ncbi:hypothetical protein L6452_15432 [Arctium lappa]|uniref:Uncharacterized protein n=1 Tax=Arctium lappa TaxID=4217 RepID=A0ACB9CNP0_ARCLA|nr:hypothetical protein L6452_15432 [Arctium lappa]